MNPITAADLATVAGVALLTSILFQFVLKSLFFSGPTGPARLDRFGPLTAIATGIVIAILGMVLVPQITALTIINAILLGIVGGLTAIGVFKGTKSLIAGG